MLLIKPISEKEATGEVTQIYAEIKNSFNLYHVPLIFKYLAAFPEYLIFIWKQLEMNLNDSDFQNYCLEISHFTQIAIEDIYIPMPSTLEILLKVKNNLQEKELKRFSKETITLNSQLYFFSLSIRESLKGKFLGIKQIGQKVGDREKVILDDMKDEYHTAVNKRENKKDKQNISTKSNAISKSEKKEIVISYTEEFFQAIKLEMSRLAKMEDYLTRRVELERFAINKLPLIPHPIDSSITAVFKKNFGHPLFPELIYLISDHFPSHSPYKLLTSAVIEKTLK